MKMKKNFTLNVKYSLYNSLYKHVQSKHAAFLSTPANELTDETGINFDLVFQRETDPSEPTIANEGRNFWTAVVSNLEFGPCERSCVLAANACVRFGGNSQFAHLPQYILFCLLYTSPSPRDA